MDALDLIGDDLPIQSVTLTNEALPGDHVHARIDRVRDQHDELVKTGPHGALRHDEEYHDG